MRYDIFLHAYCFVSGNSGEHNVFTHCVKQLAFGFFSVNDDGAKHHMTDASDQLPDFFHGTKNELYSFLIEKFSFPGSIVLDMTGCQGNVRMCTQTLCKLLFCTYVYIQSVYCTTLTTTLYSLQNKMTLSITKLIVLRMVMSFPLTISPFHC